MKKNRLQDQTHTRKDVFVFAIDEKDLPPSNKTAASKLTKKYVVTITFSNGEFTSVKNAFPANRDQRAVYRVLADINSKIDEIAERMDKDASVQEMVKIQESEEKRSPGKRLGRLVVKDAAKSGLPEDSVLRDIADAREGILGGKPKRKTVKKSDPLSTRPWPIAGTRLAREYEALDNIDDDDDVPF